MSRYKHPLRLCVSNKILRSANAKYHHSYLFFHKMNKGDLPFDVFLFLCFFFGYEIIDLVVFFGCYCLTPVTLLNNSPPQKTTKSMISHQKNTGIHHR